MTLAMATVITSLVVGVVQAIAAYRRYLAPQRNAMGDINAQQELRGGFRWLGPNVKRWCWFTAGIAGGSLILSPILGAVGGLLGYLMSIIVIPLATLIIAFQWPIPWGWAASSVAILHGMTQLAVRIGGASPAQGDVSTVANVYVVNAVLVSLIVFARSCREHRA